MIKHFVAIDNVCAWPNLTMLPNGEIVAVIWNQPCHLKWEGDCECWASTDGGESWLHRGMVTQHEPDTARGNIAVGLANNGDLIALVAGWSDKPKVPGAPFRAKKLLPWICRSSDNGATWTCEGELPGGGGARSDIVAGPNGTLHVAAYITKSVTTTKVNAAAVFLTSRDDGHTWEKTSTISDEINETFIMHVGGGRWLAAGRTNDRFNQHLDLYVSEDDGCSWQRSQTLTGMSMIPGHLLKLRDGRILLSYGIRLTGCRGIGIRFSEDKGKTWTKVPTVLVQFGYPTDNGYPSSIERDDGTIVTAWYSKGTTMHSRYHMGVTCWTPDDPRLRYGGLTEEDGYTAINGDITKKRKIAEERDV